MATGFRSSVTPEGVEVTLVEKRFARGAAALPRSRWRSAGGDRAALRALDSLVDQGLARATDISVSVPLRAAVGLASEVADTIGLPPLADLGLAVALESRIESPAGRLRLRWTDRSKREVVPAREGIVLVLGDREVRLSAAVFAVVEAAEAYNATFGASLDERVAAWMPMQAAFRAISGRDIKRDSFLDTFTLYQAGSFALDVHEDGLFSPLLMGRSRAPSLEDNAPAQELGPGSVADSGQSAESGDTAAHLLLSPEDQRAFVDAFSGLGSTRDAYRVGRNHYVLVDPSLRRALDVVKAKRIAGEEERRRFLRNPRAQLAEALTEAGDETSSALLFVETQGYSDRVSGLGLWEKPKIPWMTRPPNGWLPEGGGPSTGRPSNQRH